HGDNRDALPFQPVDQLAQVGGHRREAAQVFVDGTLGTDAAPARPDRGRVDIPPSATGGNPFEASVHGTTSTDPIHEATSGWKTGCSSCSPVPGGDRYGCGNEVGARLVHGLYGTKHNNGHLIALESVSPRYAQLDAIFMGMGVATHHEARSVDFER